MTMESLQGIFCYLFFYGATYSFFLLLAALVLSPVLYYRGSPTVRRVFGIGVKFLVSMFVMTIICGIIWGRFVDGKVYDCTDPMFGYLSPDGWVGGNHWPVIVVKQVDSDRPTGDPDEIKEGWSVADLWVLWFLFFGTSLVISILFAWWPDPAEGRLKSIFCRLGAMGFSNQAGL
jgi:hypothetical protein